MRQQSAQKYMYSFMCKAFLAIIFVWVWGGRNKPNIRENQIYILFIYQPFAQFVTQIQLWIRLTLYVRFGNSHNKKSHFARGYGISNINKIYACTFIDAHILRYICTYDTHVRIYLARIFELCEYLNAPPTNLNKCATSVAILKKRN